MTPDVEAACLQPSENASVSVKWGEQPCTDQHRKAPRERSARRRQLKGALQSDIYKKIAPRATQQAEIPGGEREMPVESPNCKESCMQSGAMTCELLSKVSPGPQAPWGVTAAAASQNQQDCELTVAPQHPPEASGTQHESPVQHDRNSGGHDIGSDTINLKPTLNSVLMRGELNSRGSGQSAYRIREQTEREASESAPGTAGCSQNGAEVDECLEAMLMYVSDDEECRGGLQGARNVGKGGDRGTRKKRQTRFYRCSLCHCVCCVAYAELSVSSCAAAGLTCDYGRAVEPDRQ